MTHPSKTKGNGFERELVNQAKEKGLESKRAYASNGESLGMDKEVDLLINDWRIQAKRRKKGASYLKIPTGCDAVVFRFDNGKSQVLLDFNDFLDYICKK